MDFRLEPEVFGIGNMEHINLSQELIDQYKEAFSLFDEDGDGLITGEELGIVIRALGHTVTEAEIDELILGKSCIGAPFYICNTCTYSQPNISFHMTQFQLS